MNEPTPGAVQRVMRENNIDEVAARSYILKLAPNLICIDCGSTNHTHGHGLCNY